MAAQDAKAISAAFKCWSPSDYALPLPAHRDDCVPFLKVFTNMSVVARHARLMD